MKSICVFCGSGVGVDPAFADSAKKLARIIVERNLTLVYGGGSIGLMGILADEVLSGGGRVIGIIPQFLYDLEVGHKGLTELIIVKSMHQRKEKMAEMADAFVAMPGGFGTLDEMAEILTWIQLKIIRKPFALLNINGFFNAFILQLDHMVEESLLHPENRKILLTSDDPLKVIALLMEANPFRSAQFIHRHNI